jgi:hypothetical protein
VTLKVTDLQSRLAGLRASVLKNLAGLTEDDARRVMVDSGTNLAGLIQHLTFVEWKWLGRWSAGGAVSGDRSMHVDPSVTLRELRANYRAAYEASDAAIRSRGGDLGAAVLVVIEETARHAGHADIIREQIDGQIGR